MLALARFAAALMAVLMLAGGASAQSVAAADQMAIHAVISAQIDALRRDDYDGAYAEAAPAIKALYPTSAAFGAVIKSRYAPLVRPKSVVFGPIASTSGGPLQHIFITGADSRAYIATYSMQQQPDNSWLITGCTIVRDNDSSSI